jgi:polyhydroxyalkanoate synthesis regulator phasin
MKAMSLKKLLLIGGGALLLLLCVVFGALFASPLLASARSSGGSQASATPTATSTNYCQQYLQDLANRLHVSVSTLRQDSNEAIADVLNQMVKDGKLTQKEADAIKQRLTSRSACGVLFRQARRGAISHLLKPYAPDLESQIAQGLHLSVDQLKAQLRAGKTLKQIADAQHVSASQLHTLVLNAIDKELDKAAQAGTITQQQANAIKQYLQKHPQVITRLVNRRFKSGNL